RYRWRVPTDREERAGPRPVSVPRVRVSVAGHGDRPGRLAPLDPQGPRTAEALRPAAAGRVIHQAVQEDASMAGAAAPAAHRRLVEGLFEDIAARHPRSLAGVQEARAAAPDRYPELADTFLGWAARAWGGDHLPRMVDAFVRFTTGVNMAQ